MIAENDIYMKAAAEEMYIRSADEMIEQRCRARNDYQKQINTHNRTLRQLDEANQTIESQQLKIESQQQEIESLKQQLALLKNQDK